MGAWGTGPFENDDAMDWFAELEDNGRGYLRRTILYYEKLPPWGEGAPERMRSDGQPLERQADDDASMLACAEIIAALAGYPSRNGDTLPLGVNEWVQSKRKPWRLPIKSTLQFVREISVKSELRELWEESDDFDSWFSSVEDLIARLKSAAR